jgi:hypothetical protein
MWAVDLANSTGEAERLKNPRTGATENDRQSGLN